MKRLLIAISLIVSLVAPAVFAADTYRLGAGGSPYNFGETTGTYYLGTGYNAPNWSYVSATSTWTPNPTKETNINDNPGMDANWGGTDWSLGGGVATKVAGANTRNLTNAFSPLVTVGRWYYLEADFVMTSGSFLLMVGGIGSRPLAGSGHAVIAARAGTTAAALIQGAPTNAGTADNFYCYPLTTSHLFALRNYGAQKAVAANLTMTAGIPGGVVARYSDANNYVICWHDGTNLRLDTVIGGTVTSKISTAATYGVGRTIEIRWADANTAQAFYNGSQVGANQDVTTVPAGNWAGMFGTDSTVSLVGLTIS